MAKKEKKEQEGVMDKYSTKASWRPPGEPHPLDVMIKNRPLKPPVRKGQRA